MYGDHLNATALRLVQGGIYDAHRDGKFVHTLCTFYIAGGLGAPGGNFRRFFGLLRVLCKAQFLAHSNAWCEKLIPRIEIIHRKLE
jgi:hypothetical protein